MNCEKTNMEHWKDAYEFGWNEALEAAISKLQENGTAYSINTVEAILNSLKK